MRRMFVNALCVYYSFREVFQFTFYHFMIKKIRYNQFFIRYDQVLYCLIKESIIRTSLIYTSFCYRVLFQKQYLQPIITQYFIDNKSEIWLLFLIAHSKR